ncbi:MAG TPA: TIR domain-containing protein [Caulobacteraceae bacterium]|nr:TIR domain-containing protein [Caulobacteraceae bacterium]
MTDGGTPAARYRAFISYSHKDAAFGRRLHRLLEGYAVPRRLVGRETPRGVVGPRLAPIFRDREELPAASDLSEQVQAALAASGALVVICSPAAAASPWVSREVALFRRIHPDRPVLAALIAGEPADSFPEALRLGATPDEVVEPLAADFRKDKDGERLGLLKLVAGIIGIGLDELVQRDAQRRLQRVTAVTAGAVAGMLAMGVLTILALDARAEAERQRAEAEGLVEFMMTDLRGRLEGVGRLDVLTAVNLRALGYYEGQNLERLPPESLERRAAILHAMGEDDERRGDLDRALAQFREARRTTAALLEQAPDKADRIYGHAQSEYWVALIDWRRGRLDDAEAGLRRYADLAGRLLAIDPSNPDWRMEAGYAESNLGTLDLRDRGDGSAAELRFTRALAHFGVALKAKPGDPDIRRDIADGYAWLADSQRAQERFERAAASRMEERRILTALQAEDPKNAVFRRDLLGNALGLAQIDLDQGRAAVARARLAEAHVEARLIAAADPADEKLAKQRIATGLFLAKAMLLDGAPAAEVNAALAECGLAVSGSDQEIRDLCAVLAARAAGGGEAGPAFDYVRANRARMVKVRRSPRWGIDFSRELEAIGDQK